MKKLTTLFLVFGVTIALVAFSGYQYLPSKWKKYVNLSFTMIKREVNYVNHPPSYLTVDSTSYFKQMAHLETKKKDLLTAYQSGSAEQKEEVLNEGSTLLFQYVVDSITPYWYGTPWDFNGISQQPQSGQVACGYFVFTVLRDAGFNIPRIGMSQAASESAIKAYVSESNIKRHSGTSIEDYLEDMTTWGDGFYLVGLDYHIGMLWIQEQESYFIHSTVIHPQCVVKEKAMYSPALIGSNYRVSGKLSAQNDLILNWLNDTYIPL